MTPQAFTVVWDGTARRPMGRYLCASPERRRTVVRRVRPLGEIAPSEVHGILMARAVFDAAHVARAFGVDVETVEFLVAADRCGALVRSA